VPIGVDGLIARAKEFLSTDLVSNLDPGIKLAMSGFTRLLNAGAASNMGAYATMESYLGALPSSLALLFTRIFFPAWELIAGAVMKPVLSAINPAVDDLAAGLADAEAGVTAVRDGIAKVKAAQTQFAQGIDESNAMSALGAIIGAQASGDLNDPMAMGAQRKGQNQIAQAAPISSAELASVTPDHKWKPPGEEEEEEEEEGAGGSVDAADAAAAGAVANPGGSTSS